MEFINNSATRNGGGIYAEYITTDFIFSILNRGCFLQYNSNVDVPPDRWVSFLSYSNYELGWGRDDE